MWLGFIDLPLIFLKNRPKKTTIGYEQGTYLLVKMADAGFARLEFEGQLIGIEYISNLRSQFVTSKFLKAAFCEILVFVWFVADSLPGLRFGLLIDQLVEVPEYDFYVFILIIDFALDAFNCEPNFCMLHIFRT
jgi:hypothetical protein